ncbi:hypothetical protein GUITHDRAFT_148833 [Guillardia theta CCMP2712]|uniref:Uncharacterized protein n=1 Tax=Guillardia theta (strain CCMP2712) TaxID=905079 RepID=L1I7N8_GUITC|nr:hypothetical protein GUITHDRAFT_148833 [Guillardia theta CCMP2712]EKX32107.1 hypothetical protein GUITHDRAFT_148833 [Guillardia theta CCMP2712]|eukprot:XP_005819087.1 hypothetical protein GUITHDRAFT_148833 [Guillardia theta CCMP2712]
MANPKPYPMPVAVLASTPTASTPTSTPSFTPTLIQSPTTVKDAILLKTSYKSIISRVIAKGMFKEIAKAHSSGVFGLDLSGGSAFHLDGKTVTLSVKKRKPDSGRIDMDGNRVALTDSERKDTDLIACARIATEFFMVCRDSKKFIRGIEDTLIGSDVYIDIDEFVPECWAHKNKRFCHAALLACFTAVMNPAFEDYSCKYNMALNVCSCADF